MALCMSLAGRFVFYVLQQRAGELGGDGVLWAAADLRPVAAATGLPEAEVATIVLALVDLGLLEPADVGGVPHYVLAGGGA